MCVNPACMLSMNCCSMSCYSKLVHGVHREVHRIAQHRVECERKAFNVVVKLVECTSAEDGELEEVVCMCWTYTSCTYVVGTHKWYVVGTHKWYVVGTHKWYVVGTHKWYVVGTHKWYRGTCLRWSLCMAATSLKQPAPPLAPDSTKALESISVEQPSLYKGQLQQAHRQLVVLARFHCIYMVGMLFDSLDAYLHASKTS